MTQKTSKILLADVLLFLVALIWGGGFIATRYALDGNMSTGLIMSLRFIIAAVIMFFAFFKELKDMTKIELQLGITAGTLVFLGFLIQTIGFKYTTPSNSAFLTTTNVIMVPFISWLIFKDRPTNKAISMAVLCFFGATVLTYNFKVGFVFNIGDLLTIACAAGFASHISFLGHTAGRINVKKLSFLQMITAAVLSVIYLFIFEPASIAVAIPTLDKGLPPVLYLGLFSTCLCYFIQTYAQSKTTPTKTALILSLEGFFGSVFSVLLGMEALTINLFLGGAIILSSVIFMDINIPFLKKRN